MSNTIFALATPAGKSGVAVIRLSGPQVCAALKTLTRRKPPAPQQFHLATLYAPATGAVIDRALPLYFKAPRSFTGEDVVELHTHGSLAVIRELLAVLAGMDGLRPAEPGEFTRRAFVNGKMDLTQAEGLADVIAAETHAQKSQAMQQLEGTLSSFYSDARRRMVSVLAHLEAYIDFPDEDIPEAVLQGLAAEVDALKHSLMQALAQARRGEAMREGVNVVILGAPNAGKSSLLNALAGKEAAIVSPQAGTTRDIIEVHLQLAGFAAIVMDTAGLRETTDAIESEGVRRAQLRAKQADITLVLFDAGALPALDDFSLKQLGDASLMIVSKCDALPKASTPPPQALCISVHTGEGMDELLQWLTERVAAFFAGDDSAPMVTRERHRALLSAALGHLERFSLQLPIELACEELRSAAHEIGKITGKIAVDDVLDAVFKEFCIGK